MKGGPYVTLPAVVRHRRCGFRGSLLVLCLRDYQNGPEKARVFFLHGTGGRTHL